MPSLILLIVTVSTLFIQSSVWSFELSNQTDVSVINQKNTTSNAHAFIERLYVNILGRSPDATGMQYWLNQLQTQKRTAAKIASGFFYSLEFAEKRLDNTGFVDILYQSLFKRPPDPAGLKYWLGKLQSGTLRKIVLNGFLSSQEFIELTQSIKDIHINSEPVALDDLVDVVMNESFNIDVLYNDFDPDNDMIKIDSFNMPVYGDVKFSTDELLTYTPKLNFSGQDSFVYKIIDEYKLTAQAEVTINVQPKSSSNLLKVIENTPSESWVKINKNRFDDVWANEDQIPAPIGYTMGNPDRVISAWGSMAIDSKRSQLIFFGGGHANYSGNEIYLFDLNTLLWKRGSLPSDVINLHGDGQFFAVDGPFNAPASAHTYDNSLYLPIVDRFITFGGGKFYNGVIFVKEDGITQTGPYLWDPNLANANKVGGTTGSHVNPELYPDVLGGQMWENRDTIISHGIGEDRPGWFVNSTTAYSKENEKDVVYISASPRNGGDLFKYTVNDINDPDQDVWELVGVMTKDPYANQGAGAYDPVRKIYVRNANFSSKSGFVYWDLNNPGADNRSHNFLPLDITGRYKQDELFGLDYDLEGKRFVLWDGGPEVWYLLPPQSGIWSDEWRIERTKAHLSVETPLQQDGTTYKANGTEGVSLRGVLGKWKYSQKYNVFFGVINQYAGDIWLYKP